MALSLNGVDPGGMHPITGSTCRAKCSNILHDNTENIHAKIVQSIQNIQDKFKYIEHY